MAKTRLPPIRSAAVAMKPGPALWMIRCSIGMACAHSSNDERTVMSAALNADAGTTLVLVTHDEHLASRCHRLLRLDGGELVSS